MVLEVAILTVKPDETQAFEQAFQQASRIISSMDGFIDLELQRSLDLPNRYILLVRWNTLDDHTIGFRQSPDYQDWSTLLHHFYSPAGLGLCVDPARRAGSTHVQRPNGRA